MLGINYYINEVRMVGVEGFLTICTMKTLLVKITLFNVNGLGVSLLWIGNNGVAIDMF